MNSLEEILIVKESSIYRNGALILDQIDFSLHNAELIYILGESGSGKSTLLKALYGLVKFSAGQAFLLNKDLNRISTKELQLLRRQLGLIFQDFRLFMDKTVYDNLNIFLKSILFKDPIERKKLIHLMLEKVKIANKSDKKAYHLSGGELQRLAIARALIHKPKIVLADEPTGNLNHELSFEIFKLLRTLALSQGTSIIIATHDEAIMDQFPSKSYYCEAKKFIKRG